MSRASNDVYKNGRLWNGFDYSNQAWVVQGRYVDCGHPEDFHCNCFGRLNEGVSSQATFESDLREFADGKPGAPSYVSSQPSISLKSLRPSIAELDELDSYMSPLPGERGQDYLQRLARGEW